MRTVCVVVTARPSYSRIKTALQAIQAHPGTELRLVVAASALLDRYGTAIDFIERDGFEVAARVHMVLEGGHLAAMAKTAGIGLMELTTVFDNMQPDVVVTIADRFETIATAVAAAYMNIPLAHVQGGEVTGSIDEKVRHAVTKLADLHLVSCQPAAERLLRMGERASAVHVTGCPSIDLAAQVACDPALTFDPFDTYGGVGARQDLSAGYIVVLQHPVTTEYEAARAQTVETLEAADQVGLPVLWFWPNVDAGSDGTSGAIRSFREQRKPRQMHFFKNMASLDFLRLLCNAKLLVGNSSVGVRECSFLGVPVVNVGTRQVGRDRGANVIDVGYARDEIGAAIDRHLANGLYPSDPLYGDGHAGTRIAALLAGEVLGIDKRLTY